MSSITIPSGRPECYTLITTGLADPHIYKIFTEIIRHILDNFENGSVRIINFDKGFGLNGAEKIIEKLNEIKHPALCSSECIPEDLLLHPEHSLCKDHRTLFLDFAHEFTYPSNSGPDVKVLGGKYYNRKYRYLISINVLRAGYLVNPIPQAIFASEKCIVFRNGKIQTLTLKMLRSLKGLGLLDVDHDDFVEFFFVGLIKSGIKNSDYEIKSLYYRLINKVVEVNSIGLFNAQDIINPYMYNKKFLEYIVNIIIDDIWEDKFPTHWDTLEEYMKNMVERIFAKFNLI